MDPFLKQHYVPQAPVAGGHDYNVHSTDLALTPLHFQMGQKGLLYFIDADFKPRLCFPKACVNFILCSVHESAYKSAHASPEKLIKRLREVFFWTSMRYDAVRWCKTCDICQKTKIDRQKKAGGLQPAHIPRRPFSTVTLDLITGLPVSDESKYTAILVLVDKLSKFGVFVPTHNELTSEGFAQIFVEKIVLQYGVPRVLILDWDGR